MAASVPFAAAVALKKNFSSLLLLKKDFFAPSAKCHFISIFLQVMLGSLLALIHSHRLCLTVDKEAVAAYDTRLKEERKRADDQALYYAGVFLLYVDRFDKAKEYVDRWERTIEELIYFTFIFH